MHRSAPSFPTQPRPAPEEWYAAGGSLMSYVNPLLPALLLAAAFIALYREALRRPALTAILLLVPASAGAWDQQLAVPPAPSPPSAAADPTAAPDPAANVPPGMRLCPNWKPGDPPCYLTEAHYQDLLRRIGNGRFAPPPPDRTDEVIAAVDRTTEAVNNIDGSGSSADWQWSWGVTAGVLTVVQTGEPDQPWITRAEGFARAVDPDSHFGVQAGGGVGPWFLDGHNAVAVGGHAAVLASWDAVALLVGADLTHLANTNEDRGGLLMGTAFLAPELHGENVLVRALVGIATESEDPALSGLVLGLSLGGKFNID